MFLQCRYFVAFTFDTTLGVALAIGFHTLALNAANYNASHSHFAARIAECGSYGMIVPMKKEDETSHRGNII
jgi:hypothetical protein